VCILSDPQGATISDRGPAQWPVCPLLTWFCAAAQSLCSGVPPQLMLVLRPGSSASDWVPVAGVIVLVCSSQTVEADDQRSHSTKSKEFWPAVVLSLLPDENQADQR